MISLEITTPVLDDLIFSNKIVINYTVKDSEGLFNSVIFNIDGVIIEKTKRTDLFEFFLPEGDHTLIAYIKNKYGKEIISTRNTISFSTKPVTLELKNQLSSVVSSSIPDYLEQDYGLFVEFVKQYYKWLESTKDPNLVPHNLQQFLDIDTVPPEFLSNFYQTYIASFPTQFSKDKETGADLDITKVIKRIKEFYSRKGTEDSFRFMFRLMFDTEITFTYPRQKMLFVSTGEWIRPTFIRAKLKTEEDLSNIQGKEIYHLDENDIKTFSAYVDDIIFTSYNNKQVATLYLVNVNGTLNDSYILYDTIVQGVKETIMVKLYTMITDVSINSCNNYDHIVGEKLKLIPSENEITCSGCTKIQNTDVNIRQYGQGFLAQIKEVNKYGSIQKITILDPGVDYELNNNNLYSSFVETQDRTCLFSYSLSYIFYGEGHYKTKKSLLSQIAFLQDNFYYQQNSYEVGSPVTPYRYSEILKQNVHPAGYKPFYRYDVIDKVFEKKTISDEITTSVPPQNTRMYTNSILDSTSGKEDNPIF